MRSKGFAALEILLVVIVLTILASGVWLWQSQKTATPFAPSPTPLVTATATLVPTSILTPITSPTPVASPLKLPSPTPTVNPTAGWNVYTNKEYGFQVEYPLGMVLGPEPKAPDSELLSSRIIHYPEAANSIGEGVINFAVRSVSMITAWESLAGTSAVQYKFNDLTARKIEWVDDDRSDGVDLYNQEIFLDHNDLSYTISLYIDDSSSQKEDFFMNFNLILSTFKFLD